MYNTKLTKEEIQRVARGDTETLLSALIKSDIEVTKALKHNKNDTAFLQGASSVIDKLIEILKSV